MSTKFRGLAIPVVLFFVMAAFFAASAMVVRVRQETRATLLESSRLQRESLARSAIASLLAVLNHEGTESGHQELSFDDAPSGMTAHAWVERESDEVLFLLAEVKGGLGEPVSIQQVVHKKPAVEGVDYAQLSDGDVGTSDTILYRPTAQDGWQSLPAPGVGLTFLRADHQGGLWALFLPSLNGHPGPGIPPEFMQTVVAKNDSLVRDGSLNTAFLRRLSEVLEFNYEVTLDGDLILSGGGVAGNAGNGGNSKPPPTPTPAEGRLLLQDLASGLTSGAELYHYSSDKRSWEGIPIEMPETALPLAQVPGKPVSDGASVYVPVLRRGPDAIRRYTYESERWEDVPPPPALEVRYKAPSPITPGAPPSSGSFSGNAGSPVLFGGVAGPEGPAPAGKVDGGAFGAEPDFTLEQSNQPSQCLVELETDANGNLYAHHGDANLYTISRRDAVTGEWSALPPPPGVFLDEGGKRIQARRFATTWGDLEIGSEGEVYVLWRASEDIAQIVSFTPGFGAGVSMSIPSYHLPSPDVVLMYKDGQWSPTSINTSTFHQTGGLASRPDGKLTLQDLRPMGEPDCYFTTDLSGLLSEPIQVPDPTSGGLSEYFGLTPGARPVPDRFVFEPTAEW